MSKFFELFALHWLTKKSPSISLVGQYLTVNADRYTPSNEQLIPTGEIKSVPDTPYDFTQPKLIGEGMERLKNTLGQKYPGGYDLNYVLNGESDQIKLAATLYEPQSGRVMELHTNQPRERRCCLSKSSGFVFGNTTFS